MRALRSLAGLKSLEYDYISSVKLHLGLPRDPKWLKQFFHQLRCYPSVSIGIQLQFYFAYPFIKLCLLMFQTRGYLPVPAPSLPAPDLLSSLCHRILPLEKAVRERVTHPLSHMSKPPIPSGLLHRVPALLHTSEMELSLPAPAWTWLPHCHSSSEFPSGFQPSPIPRSLNESSFFKPY